MMATVYDAKRHRMLCFGGQNDMEFENELWALSLDDPPAWSVLTPGSAQPPDTREATAVIDPQDDQLIVFGGCSCSYANATWSYSLGDSVGWRPLNPYGTRPGGRAGHAAVYDEARQRMLIWGGLNGLTVLNDTWELNLTPRALAVPPSTAQPELRAVIPNPSTGTHLWLSLVLPGEQRGRVQVLDVAGRVVATREIPRTRAGDVRVDLADSHRFSPGLYFVRVTQGPRALTRKICVVN
jgi:hypothetical protein